MHCDTNSAILIPSYYIPNGLKGHIEIVMDMNVSHSSNRGPVNLGMPGLMPYIDPLRRFAPNLEVANDSVLELARAEDRLPAGAASSTILRMHAMTCSTYARWDFTTARLRGEPRRGSSDLRSGESPLGRAFSGVVQRRRPSSLGTMALSRNVDQEVHVAR